MSWSTIPVAGKEKSSIPFGWKMRTRSPTVTTISRPTGSKESVAPLVRMGPVSVARFQR